MLYEVITIRTSENVTDIIEKDGVIQGVVSDKGIYHAHNVILAPGRIGANWVSSLALKYGIELRQRGIEVA